jgi:stress response protein YsnF
MDKEPEEIVVPIISEETHPGTRRVKTGGVRIVKRAVPHEAFVEQEVHDRELEVERVPVDREVDDPLEPRQEGDTLIVPVLEEVLRIQRVWVLREEIHIRRVTRVTRHQETVIVTRDEADVQRLDAAGNMAQE